MVLLRDSWILIKWNKCDTHRESSIGWLKFMSPITTLHNIARSKVDTDLINMSLTPAEVYQFIPTRETKNKMTKSPNTITTKRNRESIQTIPVL